MASKAEAKSTYVHFVPPAKKVPNWYEKYNFILVTSMEQLEQIFKDSNWTPGRSFISFDTETTGLDPEDLDIVGYSFCIDGLNAYYVPINHFQYKHNLGEPACAYFYERMCEAKKVFVYNARFDFRVFEYMGYKEHKEEFDKKHRWNYVKYDMSKVQAMDVMNAVWNADTNIKMPSLKASSLHFLGYEQMHFDEVIEEVGNFYYLNPEDTPATVYYAAADALCTYLLVPAVMKYYKESGLAGQLDDAVLYPVMHYESEKLWLDYDKLCRMYDEASDELMKCEREVYDALGYQINLNSAVQVAQALERIGVDTGVRTDSGKMATGIRVLEGLSDEVKNKFPALKAYVNYKEVGKLMSTYISVYKREAENRGYLRASYKLHQVPTGRFACGTDGKNPYFSKVNIQAMPKPHVAMYDVYDLGDRDLFSKKDNIILGYQFILSEYDSDGNHIVNDIPNGPKYIGQAEGMNQRLNIRSCITPKWSVDDGDEEYIYCAADYSAQELRIVANMSKEPVWTDAFVNGRDVHKSTACAVWGEENYNKDLRKRAKGVNFCEVEGNLVLRSDIGYVPAESIKSGDVLEAFNSTTSVIGVERLENEPCIELTFNNGIKASYHEMHKLLCWNGSELVWVRVKDLDNSVQVISFRDKNVIPEYKSEIIDCDNFVNNIRNRQKYHDFIDKNSWEIAYLMGLYVGDGHIGMRRGKAHDLSQCVSPNTLEQVIGIIKRTGIDSSSIKTSFISNDNVALLSYGGVGVLNWMAENFGTPKNKKIPDWIFTDWSKESMIAFISGYVDSDGSFDVNGKGVCISSSYPDLLHKVALVCSLLGLRTYFSKYESAIYKDGKKITEGKHGKFKDSFTLYIYEFETLNHRVLNTYKVLNCRESRKWNTSWLINSQDDAYRNFINPIRESESYISGENKKLDNFIGNLRDGRTGPTEHSLREAEKVTDKCPIKSDWYPIKVLESRRFTGSIVAIECDTHEYISMSLNSHNSVIYGASAASFNDPAYGIHSLSEAEDFYNNYKSKLPTLFQWIDRKQRQGRKNGTIYTYFGRPRRVKGYFDNHNASFANRTIVNTQIQGTAGDMLKLVCCRLWKNLLNNDKYKDDVRFMLTIHDEIGYSVRVKRLEEILDQIEANQTITLKEWPIPIITEASCGWSPGELFAFEKVEDESRPFGFTYRPKLD